jgi:RNA polymerase sigma-70 factor, ECF subfamily
MSRGASGCVPRDPLLARTSAHSAVTESTEQLPPWWIAQLYEELRTLARSHLRGERTGHTLSTTALVHEAYLRLSTQLGLAGLERTAFFGAASQTMRRILVDHARGRQRAKRGGGEVALSLDAVELFLSDRESEELVLLDDALERLKVLNPRAALIVERRFFGGLSLEDVADSLDLSRKTVQRDWAAARAWLRKEIATDLGLGDA